MKRGTDQVGHQTGSRQELPAEPIGFVGPAVGVTEDEITVLVAGADEELLLGLACTPAPEHPDGAGIGSAAGSVDGGCD